MDRLRHVRAFIAFARLSPNLNDAAGRWSEVLTLNRYHNPSEGDVFTCGVVHLFLCFIWYRLGDICKSRQSFWNAVKVIKEKRPQFLIPGVGTYLFQEACGKVNCIRQSLILPRLATKTLGDIAQDPDAAWLVGLGMDRDLDLRPLSGNMRRNSWPSGRSPIGHCHVSRTHSNASNGSSWSTKKPVLTPETRPVLSVGSKSVPHGFAFWIYGIGEDSMMAPAFSYMNSRGTRSIVAV